MFPLFCVLVVPVPISVILYTTGGVALNVEKSLSAELAIYAIDGRMIWSESLAIQNGSNVFMVDAANLRSESF